MQIEQDFLRLTEGADRKHIDFFGIDLSAAAPQAPTCKLYRSQDNVHHSSHWLVDFIRQKGMLRHFADVADSSRPDGVRTDISLQARNNSNMEALLAYLDAQVPFFAPHADTVKRMAQIPITHMPGYDYAGLYHVGTVGHGNTTELLKFHFFTRWCNDPNRHSKDGWRDGEFLTHLQQTQIPQCQKLVGQAAAALEQCGGHLWMAGMDLSDSKVKYKLYLKDIRHVYDLLPTIAGQYAEEPMERIACWNEKYPQCRPAGAAFALDTENIASLNLYYHMD